jgi:hypothetical protein
MNESIFARTKDSVVQCRTHVFNMNMMQAWKTKQLTQTSLECNLLLDGWFVCGVKQMHKQLTCSMMSFVVFCFLYVFSFLLFLSFLSFQYHSSLFLYRFLFSLSKILFWGVLWIDKCWVRWSGIASTSYSKQLDLKQLEVLQIHLTWAMSLIKSSNLINIVNILVYDT